jgi:hypothetical protein
MAKTKTSERDDGEAKAKMKKKRKKLTCKKPRIAISNRDALTAFYERYDPSKTVNVDGILRQWGTRDRS